MKSLHRAIDLILTFQNRTLLNTDEMAKTVGWPKSSVYRFVRILRERGLLLLDPETRKYRVGPVLYQLGRMGGPDLCHLARPVLESLTKESRESSYLSMRNGWEAQYADCVDSQESIRFTAPLGKGTPLYAGASAKVILAFMGEDERRTYLQTVRLKCLCIATIQSKRKLNQRLSLIRTRGYDFSQEELHRGAWGLAAPILGKDGEAVAAIAITGLKFRMPQKRLSRFISMVREGAQEISEKLNGSNSGAVSKIRRTGS